MSLEREGMGDFWWKWDDLKLKKFEIRFETDEKV
jgi:hypothetical protein